MDTLLSAISEIESDKAEVKEVENLPYEYYNDYLTILPCKSCPHKDGHCPACSIARRIMHLYMIIHKIKIPDNILRTPELAKRYIINDAPFLTFHRLLYIYFSRIELLHSILLKYPDLKSKDEIVLILANFRERCQNDRDFLVLFSDLEDVLLACESKLGKHDEVQNKDAISSFKAIKFIVGNEIIPVTEFEKTLLDNYFKRQLNNTE